MNEQIKIVRLTQDYTFKPFDCGEQDLNDFLFNDSKNYLERLMAVTYVLETENKTVGFFSVSNDKISIPDTDKASWRRIKKLFPHAKHRSDYPAVKLGRLGIDNDYKGQHIGTDVINFIKQMFITNNRTGCSFITVDALRSAIPFYKNNGFVVMDKSIAANEEAETCPLYYDLYQLM